MGSWIERCVLLSVLLVPSYAMADDDSCEFFKKFLPAIYKSVCGGGGGAARNRGARSSSTFSSSFSLNPSSTPTEKTPYGLETIGSGIRAGAPYYTSSFAIIKGYGKIGAALSTSGDNIFYGNDIVQRHKGNAEVTNFKPDETPKGRAPSLKLGTAIKLLNKEVPTSLGGALRYNKTSNTLGYGIGIVTRPKFLLLGFGISREKVSNFLPTISFYSASAMVRIPFVELEYQWLKNLGGYTLQPIQIGTVTLMMGRFMFTGAVRQIEIQGKGQVIQNHYGVQCQISSHIAGGFLYNYIPGTNSVALQIFL